MKQTISYTILAAVLAGGVMGCGTGYGTYPDPARPAFQSSQIVEGQVVRLESDSYIVRDASGRETRVFYNGATARDRIAVGDTVIARYDGPSSAYATSIARRSVMPVPPAVSMVPRTETIDGIVQWQSGNDYVIKDMTGREVRLHADNTTTRDRNIMVGDRVTAITSTKPSDAQYMANMYRSNDPNIVQGDVVWTDGNTYVVRDLSGRDVRLRANSGASTGNLGIGDKVIAYIGPSSDLHVDAIARR